MYRLGLSPRSAGISPASCTSDPPSRQPSVPLASGLLFPHLHLVVLKAIFSQPVNQPFHHLFKPSLFCFYGGKPAFHASELKILPRSTVLPLQPWGGEPVFLPVRFVGFVRFVRLFYAVNLGNLPPLQFLIFALLFFEIKILKIWHCLEFRN